MAKVIKTINPRTKAALWLLIGPSALFVICLIALLITDLVLSQTIFYNSDGFSNGQLNPIATILPLTIMSVAALSAFAFIPCLIASLMLLRKN